jgi:hypothetical protein
MRPKNNWWLISVFAVDIASADALLASANKPAAPKTGAALLRRFRFDSCLACGMREIS